MVLSRKNFRHSDLPLCDFSLELKWIQWVWEQMKQSTTWIQLMRNVRLARALVHVALGAHEDPALAEAMSSGSNGLY
jgi:hypothetical protein